MSSTLTPTSPDDDLAPQMQRRRDRWFAHWLDSPATPALRVMTLAFILGSFAHLLIADAWQPDWLVPDLFVLAGCSLLLWRTCALGFAITLPGLLWPLFMLRDQLTQSVLLALFALSMSLCLHGATPVTWRHAQRIWRGIVTSTYALAALHKINRDFLDPAVSCANYGWREIFDTWMLPTRWASPPPLFEEALPLMVIATEALIALLYVLRRRRLVWALSLAFHLPLTMTMAPAFAFVMLVGHAAWVEIEDVEHVRALWREHRARITVAACFGTAGALASVLGAHHTPEGSVVLRELVLWNLFTLCLTWGGIKAWLSTHTPHLQPRPHALTIAFLCFFWLNGLSPYSGRQVQHAGAMLSNLRVDEGCWNSLILPESIRHTDDYIRVDEVYFASPGVDPDYEELLRTHLWSPPQLRQMQRNWCAPTRRPFYLRGIWRDEPFIIEDLCALDHDELPFEGAGFFGVELFPDAIRFQKNLARSCPQACIH